MDNVKLTHAISIDSFRKMCLEKPQKRWSKFKLRRHSSTFFEEENENEGNYAKFLKNLHSEQISKLAAKNQHECDLLEDIRTFTLKRSAIEKSYSEALLKISSAYLNKKIPNIPDIKLDGGEERWNMWSVWRTVLEENEKLARARLAAVEVFQQQIADDVKLLRSHKLQTSRKSTEQVAIVHKELQTCVQDVDKTKKFYFDEEHSAHDVRDKARDIEEKLKKKKGSFFQSITSLQKNSAKFSSKRDQLEEKSTGARNDYLLCLAAANAHQNRYFVVDLQLALTSMESGVYDKVAEYFSLMGRTELLTCSAMQNSFGKIRDQAKQLTRDYNLQCCYLYYPVLKQHVQYDFEPCDNDPVECITADHDSSAATLSKEARRWATKIARENNNTKENVRKLQIFNALRESGQRNDPNDPNGPDLDSKIEDLKQNIRRSETSKMKAEARIECLRAGGVNVDEWLKEAETLTVQDIQRSASSLSDHPSSDSFYDSDFADGEPPAVADKVIKVAEHEDNQEAIETPEVDAVLEQERQRIEQLTAGWDDPTQVDWGTDEMERSDEITIETTPSGPVLKCTALYSYVAQNPDELSIVENEQLEVVGEGDGDGWLRARNYRGEEGYVPHNYLDVERDQTSRGGLVNQISFSSVDYTVDNEEEAQQQSETNQSPEQVSVIHVMQKVPDTKISYCCALYDYEGEGKEELTFEEGQIIKVLSKCAHSVDDGWWQGELDGQIGNFPSLVVEECDEYGEPLTNQWDETPPCSAPPVFTPPDIPEYLADTSEDVLITQATPIVEQLASKQAEEKSNNNVYDKSKHNSKSGGKFSMEMSPDQHEQYGSQFSAQSVPIIGVVVEDEDGKLITEGDFNDQIKSDENENDYGLGVAQIVITAATPMIEESEHSFPPIEEEVSSMDNSTEEPKGEEDCDFPEPCSEEQMDTEQDKKHKEQSEQQSFKEIEKYQEERRLDFSEEQTNIPESVLRQVSSSTGSDGETTGPSTADNSLTQTAPVEEETGESPKQVVGGRASIPDELEPHQLAQLQDLKESNA